MQEATQNTSLFSSVHIVSPVGTCVAWHQYSESTTKTVSQLPHLNQRHDIGLGPTSEPQWRKRGENQSKARPAWRSG